MVSTFGLGAVLRANGYPIPNQPIVGRPQYVKRPSWISFQKVLAKLTTDKSLANAALDSTSCGVLKTV